MPVPSRPIELIGAPTDWGASKRGARLAPEALRALDLRALLSYLTPPASREGAVIDGGMVRFQRPCREPEPGDPVAVASDLRRQLATAAAYAIAEVVEAAHHAGHFPLTIGGDHSIAIGTIGGDLAYQPNTGLIWIDAHTDYNSLDSSPSGNLHGMPVSVLLGTAEESLADAVGDHPRLDPSKVVLVGIRDVDWHPTHAGQHQTEIERVRESGVTVFTAWDVERMGIAAVTEEALAIATNGTEALHLSFDVDAINPVEFPATGTLAPGGLTFREASMLVHLVAESGKLTAMDLTEVNPLLKHGMECCLKARDLVLYAMGRGLV